jgi:pseudaminic acid cytidylyltransferase
MSSVAIIPARGGSKRIPDKNIRLFAGKPMIAHSIEAAQNSGLFDRIIVSTDSEKIAAVAKERGAEVPFMRPAELADDFTGTDAVFLHALQWLEENDKLYDTACLIYATAPFIQNKYIRQGLEKLVENDATCAFSVATFAFPVFRGLKVDSNNRLSMLWPEYRLTRSQDLPEAFHDAGQFYWVNIDKYNTAVSLYADAAPIVIPRKYVQDIDTIEDWESAELMYKVQSL